MGKVSLEDRALTISRGVNALMALHEEMEEGPSSPDSWVDGLHFIVSHLYDEVNALRADLAKEGSKT